MDNNFPTPDDINRFKNDIYDRQDKIKDRLHDKIDEKVSLKIFLFACTLIAAAIVYEFQKSNDLSNQIAIVKAEINDHFYVKK